jgi:hypothetical protein
MTMSTPRFGRVIQAPIEGWQYRYAQWRSGNEGLSLAEWVRRAVRRELSRGMMIDIILIGVDSERTGLSVRFRAQERRFRSVILEDSLHVEEGVPRAMMVEKLRAYVVEYFGRHWPHARLFVERITEEERLTEGTEVADVPAPDTEADEP